MVLARAIMFSVGSLVGRRGKIGCGRLGIGL